MFPFCFGHFGLIEKGVIEMGKEKDGKKGSKNSDNSGNCKGGENSCTRNAKIRAERQKASAAIFSGAALPKSVVTAADIVVEDVETSGGVKALFALRPGFSGQLYFDVPDQFGNRAIFRTQTEGVNLRDETDGQMKLVPFVGVYLEEAGGTNVLTALPECAKDIRVPLGQVRHGAVKPSKGMTNRDFGYRQKIAEYLFGEHEREAAFEEALRKQEIANRRAALEEEKKRREAREERDATDVQALTLLSQHGRGGVIGLRTNGNFVLVKFCEKTPGQLVALPLVVNEKHPSADAIKKLIEKRIYLQTRFVVEEIKSIPDMLKPFEAGLRALRDHIRAALQKHNLLESFAGQLPAKPIVVRLGMPKSKENSKHPVLTALLSQSTIPVPEVLTVQ